MWSPKCTGQRTSVAGSSYGHLNVLLAVAQWGNMARAAEHLAISQPSVSKAIADLENTLGVRLLDRRPQGLELTLYGRAFLNAALHFQTT